jgi:hypothetical protein
MTASPREERVAPRVARWCACSRAPVRVVLRRPPASSVVTSGSPVARPAFVPTSGSHCSAGSPIKESSSLSVRPSSSVAHHYRRRSGAATSGHPRRKPAFQSIPWDLPELPPSHIAQLHPYFRRNSSCCARRRLAPPRRVVGAVPAPSPAPNRPRVSF